METQQVETSTFIDEYVAAHQEELSALRAAATAADFDGEWYIIGDPKYLLKRQQYATTSFAQKFVSPRMILYPAQGSGDEDIRKAMTLCRKLGMAITTRTGGHQYCGYSSTSPANMQIDVSKTYPDYDYDAQNNVLRCGVSHALGTWAATNSDNGIYTPMGVCAEVNLGGHVHTGGWGMVARSHGILADHVNAFDIILASGNSEHIVRPVEGQTSQHNDDLYYAVLGGGKGGDFGIVTHWEFTPLVDADYPNSACYNYIWRWSSDKMQKVVAQMADYSKKCADGTIPSDYEFMLTITGRGYMDMMPDDVKEALANMGEIDIGKPMRPFIQMWMCFTNKGGSSESFDDQWFKSFKSAVGIPLLQFQRKNYPVSKGLAQHFIMNQAREMIYPFVKRSRVTMSLPDDFADTYTERMNVIMGTNGTANGQHLVSQQQIYAGGAVAANAAAGITSYSWRDQAMAMSHDAFHDPGTRETAETWQADNDAAFVGPQGAYSDTDMRMFAYTFGDRVLANVWQNFYDSEEKYQRLQDIKGAVDPDGLFVADQFSVQPPD